MMKHILDVEVSFYQSFSDTTKPINGSLLQIITSEKLAKNTAPLITRIRQTADHETRKNLKMGVPCFTPSGIFSIRAANGLIKHSGLMAFDVDPGKNPYLDAHTAPKLKAEISKLKQVAYCGLSVSGLGVWGLIPIKDPEHHKEHFEALKSDFEAWGIVLDRQCGNIDRLRYWSFDPEPYINPNAETYTRLEFEKRDIYTPSTHYFNSGEDAAKVEAVLSQIEVAGCDITEGYDNWFGIGCALSNAFGESGRDYFHRVSQFHRSYKQRGTDKQFSDCLKKAYGNNLGTFFYLARQSGFEYKGHFSTTIQERPQAAPQLPTTNLKPLSVLPSGYKKERYQNPETGEKWELLINADGYPANWDLTDGWADEFNANN